LAEEKRAVEREAEEDLRDEFDDVFGVDDDKKKARDRIKKLVEEEKEKQEKKEEKEEHIAASETEEAPGEMVEAIEEPETGPGEEETPEAEEPVEPIAEEPAGEKPKPKKKKKPKAKKPAEEPIEPVLEEPAGIPEPESMEEPAALPEEKPVDLPEKKEAGPVAEIVEPAPDTVKPELRFLQDGDSAVLIGRKKSVYEKYSMEAALQVGRVSEEAFNGNDVFLDSLNPHVVFVCGARGSGKSYALGVMAEELTLKNKNVGTIVIDPVGVFWSMKFPNREAKEIEALKKWGLEPRGLDNMMVFIPKGLEKETPKETYDATFSIKPALLTSTDWCLTFGIERFSPTGLLLELAIKKVQRGFLTIEKEKIRGKERDYSIDDIIFCLERDSELNSRERGYKSDSIRALVSRFSAAKSWGILDATGTPLTELSRESQLTVIDTSFLDDSVTALVIGLLARRILAARKVSTRKEAAKRMDMADDSDMLEFEIPPTWLFIDEAHTLIPSGNTKTPATEGLIEYVKQGRQPGCSLVFATQQPSAINTKVLSQLDVIMTHKLVFNDDVKAVYKRTPAIIPHKYKAGAFIKTLPVGTALIGDRREETSRAFLMKIRPRMSQHEGREAETVEVRKKLDNPAVQRLLGKMYWNRLKRDGSFKLKELGRILDSMNRKYKSSVKIDLIVSDLKAKGAIIDEGSGVVMVNPAEGPKPAAEPDKGVEETLLRPEERRAIEDAGEEMAIPEEEIPAEEHVTLLAFPARVSEAKARALIKKKKLGKLFGLLKKGQRLGEIRLKHIPVFRVEFNYFNEKKAFREGMVFVNSLSGEFLHYRNGKFIESSGLKELYDLADEEILVLNILSSPKDLKAISKKIYFDDAKILKLLKKLEERELVKRVKKKQAVLFSLNKKFDLPSTPLHPMHSTVRKLPLVETEVLMKESERYSKKDVSAMLRKIWKQLVVKNVEEIYWPVFEGTLEGKEGEKSRVLVDAVTGKVLAH